jgi:hypothetical protein
MSEVYSRSERRRLAHGKVRRAADVRSLFEVRAVRRGCERFIEWRIRFGGGGTRKLKVTQRAGRQGKWEVGVRVKSECGGGGERKQEGL